MQIKYVTIKKYKYELTSDLEYQTVISGYNIDHPFFTLDHNGLLLIKRGYKWDGVSGPMIDTKDSMIGGCVHDALYQLIRLGLIFPKEKNKADLSLKYIFLKSGMCKFRAGYAHWAVDKFGAGSCKVGDVHIPKTIVLEF